MFSITKNKIASKLTVHGASSNGDLPRCDVGNRTIRRSRVSGRANNHDPLLSSVKRTNSDTIVKKRGRLAA